jgi:DNA-binding transcriptional LysR family regulator
LPRDRHRGRDRDNWSFQDKGKAIVMKVAGNLQCNDGEVLTRWAIAGEGLAWRSALGGERRVKRGRLVTVLDEFAVPGNNIYACTPAPAPAREGQVLHRIPAEDLRRPAPYWE